MLELPLMVVAHCRLEFTGWHHIPARGVKCHDLVIPSAVKHPPQFIPGWFIEFAVIRHPEGSFGSEN